MTNSKKLKILIDILMYIDFVYLMCLGSTHKLFLHGILGIILFALFIIHHLLNLWFYKIAFKGKWNLTRIVLNITSYLLFLLMILMALSSIFMSGLVFSFSKIQATQFWRSLHLLSCSWGFLIMSFHLGLHTKNFFKKIYEKFSKAKCIYFILNFTLVLLGLFCFYKTQIYIYLFNLNGWKFSSMNFFIEMAKYFAITSSIVILTGNVQYFLNARKNKSFKR